MEAAAEGLVACINAALSVVAAMTLGIVVDDTVHYLSKYLRGRRENKLSPEEATKYAFRNVVFALSVTTIALVAGFTILAFSLNFFFKSKIPSSSQFINLFSRFLIVLLLRFVEQFL